MDLSETIIAAIIGAGATMATATFQLLRNRAGEVRPRKNRIRSLFATILLMLGCLVGGYAWSSLRAVSATEQLRSTLQAEFASQFATLAAHQSGGKTGTAGSDAVDGILPASQIIPGSAGSLVQLQPCTPAERPDESAAVKCADQALQSVTLCAAIPAATQGARLQVMVRTLQPDSTWKVGDANARTIGDLQISEALPEQPLGGSERSACLNVANWSVEQTLLVRLLVDYTAAPQVAPEPAMAPITASVQ